MQLTATFLDRFGTAIETVQGDPAEVIAKAADFMRLHGTDPDENGADAAAGSIFFAPIKGD